jgi:hypothetical protein
MTVTCPRGFENDSVLTVVEVVSIIRKARSVVPLKSKTLDSEAENLYRRKKEKAFFVEQDRKFGRVSVLTEYPLNEQILPRTTGMCPTAEFNATVTQTLKADLVREELVGNDSSLPKDACTAGYHDGTSISPLNCEEEGNDCDNTGWNLNEMVLIEYFCRFPEVLLNKTG